MRESNFIKDIVGESISDSLRTPERRLMLRHVNKIISNLYGIVYLTNFDLRVPRKDKKIIAQRNPFWTIFINKAGTLGIAIHNDGTQLLLEGETWLKGTDEAYLINKFSSQFLNKLKEMGALKRRK